MPTVTIPNLDALTALIGDLRQTWPFRYLDRITAFDGDARSMSGTVLLGHPDRYIPDAAEPVMVEALAQLSGLLVRVLTGNRLGGVLAMVERAQWDGAADLALPVDLSVTVIDEAFPIYTMHGEVRQNGRLLLSTQFSTRSNAGDAQ